MNVPCLIFSLIAVCVGQFVFWHYASIGDGADRAPIGLWFTLFGGIEIFVGAVLN